ncbi:TetR family transcriptional regulator [Streptomyces sp. NBRC 14336]|nr:TetR family transcriptional regulator [Streptomyces sp. NBRC 14336]GLW50145.1 TetR family transcriptional regulator [Streptomyces sp. NBRC 14336]
MQIARSAAALFVRQGLRATRAEDIAHAAGIAPRTFYRYFATKEEAVAPLYAAGAERWVQAVQLAPAHLSVPEVLEHAVRHTLTPGTAASASSWEWVRTLIRLAGSSPALGKVWAEVCHATEDTLARVLAERLVGGGSEGAGAESVAVEGAAVQGAAVQGVAAEGAAVESVAAESVAAEGAAVEGVAHGSDNVAGRPELRFAAAVAGAAVRVAVESWAAGRARPQGPEGPAELALRNLAVLRDFPWGEVARGD